MRAIVGIGNSDNKFKDNRHNVGYVVADKIKKSNLESSDLVILKTNTWMNNSGDFVLSLCKKNKIDTKNLYIIHDDLDIKLGSYKIQFGKGPKDHNGLIDIYKKLGTRDFWHIRIGIENRKKSDDKKTKGEKYVLEDFTLNERQIIDGIAQKLISDLSARFESVKK